MPNAALHVTRAEHCQVAVTRALGPHGNRSFVNGYSNLFFRSDSIWSPSFDSHRGDPVGNSGGTQFGGPGNGDWGVGSNNSFSTFPSGTLEYGRRRGRDEQPPNPVASLTLPPLASQYSPPPLVSSFDGSSFIHSSSSQTTEFLRPKSLPTASQYVQWQRVSRFSNNHDVVTSSALSASSADQNSTVTPSKLNASAVSSASVSRTASEPSVGVRRRKRTSNSASPTYKNAPQNHDQSRGPPPRPNKPYSSKHSGHQFQSKLRRQVRAIFERAKEEERNGNLNEARILLRQCLDLDKQDSHSWLALARLESRAGGVSLRNLPHNNQNDNDSERPSHSSNAARGTEIARSIFKLGLDECPNSVHLIQAWAVLEHRCGNRDIARQLFARGLALEPDNAYVSQAWGLLEQRVGNTDKARELFRQTVSLRPHPEVCAAWAVLEAREGNIHYARDLYVKGLRACKTAGNQSSAAIFRSWAEMEERVGDLPKARELLNKAIATQPRMTEAYVALARLEARRGGTTRAVELMRAAASLSPKPPASVFNAWAQIEWTCCGRVDEARTLLKKGHDCHPSDPAILQSLGTLEERCGNPEEAKRLFYSSVCARPTAPAFVAWALLEEKDGHLDEAKRLFEEALSTDALHGAAYNAYGMMEARRGRLSHARAVYERGLKAHASASVWHGYGQLELKQDRNPDRARELFRLGVAQTREDTSFIWHSWGMLELQQRQVRDARRVFHDALKRYPRNSRVLVGAALAHAASCSSTHSEVKEAVEFFKRAVGADPTHAHAWQAWGVFELRRGRPDAAQALFRRGLRLCPSHGALWQAWGVLETSRGDFSKARQLYQKGAQACPAHVHLFQAWACMEVRSGNIDKARELLDHALELDAAHGAVWNAYGLLEARHGTLAKARQNFSTGIRRSPHHAPLYRAFGQAESRAGNYERARQLFQQGLHVDPRHAPLYHAYAQFEAMLGNVAALSELRKQAEDFFGSEAQAVQVLRNGEPDVDPEVIENSDENPEGKYSAMVTPMELALDGGNVYDK
ncbi:TPR repeat containing protein [Gracilaria domingensis]|nr:TPR repeat containing protein [Gracilaria domingensis]